MIAKHACILLHGIETDPETRSWVEEVQVKYEPPFPNLQLIPRKYGYVSGRSVWLSAFARRHAVDHEEAYIRGTENYLGLLQDLEPGTLISIVGHSLGGYIATGLLKRGIKFHRIAHLWGSTVSDFNWYGVDGNFDRARIYWSPEDEILTASAVAVDEDPELALGLMGKTGPMVVHPRVEAIQDPYGFTSHTAFMDDSPERDRFWADVFGWMAG